MTTQQPESLRVSGLLRVTGHKAVSANMISDAILVIESQHARITELEAARFAYASEFAPTSDGDPDVSSIHANIRALKAQLAQRFDAADMATAAAQGFRDGVASVSAGSEPVASYAIRLLVAAALITQAKADEALRLAAEITAAPGPADGESNV